MSTGVLYIISTPIGNLGDITLRALELLRTVDLILAEDTRNFQKLAKHFAIETRVESYHEHNERSKAATVVNRIKEGISVALVSDAGTPLINDPGYHLINLAIAEKIKIVPIPGASSILAALTISGFEPDKFYFGGFLPVKSGKRKEALQNALEKKITCIFFESPHRILKTLLSLAELEPERKIGVARELTKMYEECTQGTASEVYKIYSLRPSIKGECVLLIGKGYE
jgi:16S rRNA (cytidine1402-2'-O)-methyltransferase